MDVAWTRATLTCSIKVWFTVNLDRTYFTVSFQTRKIIWVVENSLGCVVILVNENNRNTYLVVSSANDKKQENELGCVVR